MQAIESMGTIHAAAMSTLMREPRTTIIDDTLNVRRRLDRLRTDMETWEREDAIVEQRIQDLRSNPPKFKTLTEQHGVQLDTLQHRLWLTMVQEPLEISVQIITRTGYDAVRANLIRQFAGLTKEDKILWMHNFLFIMTPDLRILYNKIVKVCGYRSFGQQRNFLLGGASGMGKTAFLDWLAAQYLPMVGDEYNHVPIAKIDAPVTNRTPKPLLHNILLEYGATWMGNDNEDALLDRIVLYRHWCRTILYIVDEVQHIKSHDLKLRLLEITNKTHILMICASCTPRKFVEGDVEIKGRWNDFFELRQYTGERLDQLLAFMELLLPFTESSCLGMRAIKTGPKKSDHVTGPATLIERWTGGILRDIMILLADASARAIERGESSLSTALLEETWRGIQASQVTDFLKVLQRDPYR